jgi:DNA repair exonuclease SbcCD nuclease subunit
MIIGNHDSTFFNTNEVNSCQLLLQEYQNIDVMIGPTEKTIGGRKILFIPWICEDNWKQTIHKIETTTANVIFGHLEIKDFEMYKNTFVLEGLDESIFSKFDVVASGHFHHRSKRRNIIYLGAPYEITWADHEDPRGFNIFDTESLEFQHIQNPYSCFKKVYYDDQRDTLDDINKLDFTDCKDVFVKLIVLNKSNPYWFEVFLEKLEKSSPAQIQVIQETLNLNTASDSKLFSETDDMSIILDRYVDQVDFDEKNKLQVFIKDLYNEAFTSIGT